MLFHWFVFDIEDDKHRGHGDDNPVEGGGDGGEPGVFVDLDEEAEAEPDQDCDVMLKNNKSLDWFVPERSEKINKPSWQDCDMKVKEAEQGKDCDGKWQRKQRPLTLMMTMYNEKELPNMNLMMTMTGPSTYNYNYNDDDDDDETWQIWIRW